MRRLSLKTMVGLIGAALLSSSAGIAAHAAGGLAALPAPPPPPAVKPVVENLYGTRVVDPYRYFERLQDPDVQRYFSEQNAYTRNVLQRLDPARRALLARIERLDNQGVSVSGVNLVGRRFFYEQLKPGESDPKLYVRSVGAKRGRLLVDPDRLATKPGQHFTLTYFLPSLDGHYVAYGITEGGSERSTLHVIDAATGRILPDAITRANFVGATAWRPDGRSFYYLRFPPKAPGEPRTGAEERRGVAYLHVLGRDPDHDVPVFGYGVSKKVPFGPDDAAIVTYSPASPYAIGIVAHGVQNEETLYAAPLRTLKGPHTPWREIVSTADDVTSFDLRGDTIYLVTHQNASRFKIVAMSISHPNFAAARTVVPPSRQIVLQVSVARDGLYVLARDGGLGRLLRYAPSGSKRVGLPYEGAIISLTADPRVSGAVFGLTGWTKSLLYYAVSAEGRVADTKLKPPSPVDASAYTSTEVKAKSADGTLVPLSIVFNKTIKLDHSHPTYLEGYGAYGTTIDPYFSTTRIAWLERNGVYAVCHVRGGGWYGEAWHRAGMKATKEHTIQDFIGCAQYLIERGYTSPQHLAGEGTSAGGILIGGAITQRPDLFAAALDVVGASDTLRAEFAPNGPANIPEFGSVKTKAGFEGLYAMDAYQHVKEGTPYPAVMLITGVNDPRVPPWESAKMAARLQSATVSGRPVLLYVGSDIGHGMLFASRQQDDALLADE
ncbi:MAG: S9 family peptidase, partial [bacterium]|nr:S9 family peptidase [bacterium]